jgi:gamma-glutamyltranspeptidase
MARGVVSERLWHARCLQALRFRGHTVEATAWSGVVQGILLDPVDGTLTGVSDPRKDGAPAGY